jgi:integral membrane sensor domain MASE1
VAGFQVTTSGRFWVITKGLFTGAYGLLWFVGSALMGILYDHSIPGVIAFCVIAELAAIPLLIKVSRPRPVAAT